MIIKRPISEEQKAKIEARGKPSQEDINQAASDLILYLMRRIEELETYSGDSAD